MWWCFWLGALAVLAALAWASFGVAGLERRNEAARQLAHRQETIRLALWRIDSRLAAIIASEAARPPAVEPEVRLFAAAPGRSRPFLQNAFVDGVFTVDAANRVTASDPRTLELGNRVAGVSQEADADDDSAMLGALARAAPAPGAEPPASAASVPRTADETSIEQEAAFDFAARQRIVDVQQQRAEPEKLNRLALTKAPPQPAAEAGFGFSDGAMAMESAPADGATPEVPPRLEPRWVTADRGEPDLVLVRSVETEQGPVTQGLTLDWPALRSTLVESVADLLPEAAIVPAHGGAAAQIERDARGFRLATVPALLLPGDFTPAVPFRMTPTLWALVITWIAALGALAAVGLVLRATLRLSDRRARFVGAVTHELRTPLTTFRLYAQMLAGGMVTDEKAKAEYLGTLERESVRLAEIVENVLEYARLTRRRPGAGRPPGERSVTPSELLARVRPVLSRRAEQSGMDLIVSVEPGADATGRTVTCDPRSVERILMNLVENACKYALPSDEKLAEDADTRVHLDLSLTDRHLEVLVADHGRGIPRRERERVFGEFQRGPGAAEGSRPGLGLGLALSRGLAREMGGDLRLTRRRAHGAEFLLTIPLDPPAAAPAAEAGRG
jgi:signal transduction histidine kinase